MKAILRSVACPLSIAAALLVGCSEEQPDALVGSAKSYLAKKDRKAAVIQLKSALQQKPDLDEARFLLGRTLLESGDAVSAEIELRKALNLKYAEAEVIPLLARALVEQGKGQRAIQDLAGVDLGPGAATAELRTVVALAYLQQGDGAKAQVALDAALRAAPDHAPALLARARLQALANESDAAFALVERVIEKSPDSYEAYQLKGDLLYVTKADAAAALQAERQALERRADWLPAHTSILEILLSQRDEAGANAHLEQMKKALPNHPQTRYFEGRLAYLRQDYKSANEIAQQLLTIAPDNVKVLLLAGTAALQSGSLSQAESLVAKALLRAPDSAPTRRLLAQVHLRAGHASKAQDVLVPLLEKTSVDAETLGLAADAALQSGDAANAESYFKRAAKVNPYDPRSRTALALAQLGKGKTDDAIVKLGEIAASDAGTTADIAIVNARVRQKDYRAALKAVDAIEAKQPSKPVASQLRGEIHVARQDFAAARQSFTKALSIDPLYYPAAASLASLDMRDKKPEEARKRFDKILAADPKNIRALIALAELRAVSGATKEEMATLLANASKLNPTVAAPRVMLVDLHLRNRDAAAALAAAQDGVAALPENAEMLDALGRAQVAAGDANQAIVTFKKVASLQSRSPLPQMRLADAYMLTQDAASARTSLTRALAVAPGFVPAQRALVMLELATGHPEEAKKVARAMQTERPQQPFGYLLTGDVEAFQKNWDAAAAAYRQGLRVEASPELAMKLHGVLTTATKTREAEAFSAQWIKEHPQDAAFRTYLGERAIAKADYARAESEYLAVIGMQPENALALNNLAWLTNKLKKPGATGYAEKAIALQPQQPDFLDTLATILSDAGQAGKALELEKKALAIAPEHPVFRLNLAKLYIKTGDKAQARVELDRLTKLGDAFARQAEVTELLKSL